MVWATFQSITKYRVDTDTGVVQFISGFTRPIGDTDKKPKAVPKKLNIGDIEEEVFL